MLSRVASILLQPPTTTNNMTSSVPLRSVRVVGKILDLVSEVEVTHQYVNNGDKPIEAVYVQNPVCLTRQYVNLLGPYLLKVHISS